MYREQNQSVEVSDTKYSESDGDLLINNLVYEMPRGLSLATGRTYKTFFSQRNTLPVDRNSTLVFDSINTGNDFVDPANSYLRFKMKVTGNAATTGPTFGAGSALNLFREVRLKSKSGVELSRLENANLYNAYRLKYTKSTNWVSTIGSTFYLNNGVSVIFNSTNTMVPEVTIPLAELDSFFRPLKQGQLLPPQLISGARLELSCESLARAFVDSSTYFQAGATLELVDIALVLDCVSMSDETSKLINLESSQSGLEYSYHRVHNTSISMPTGTSQGNVQVTKAVSQATHAFTTIQDASQTNNALADSFVSESYKTVSSQFRLGSSYYPNVAVQTSVLPMTTRGFENYLLTLSSFDKLKTTYQETSITPAAYANNFSVLATSLERNASLAVSGLPINNSRMLEHIFTRDNTGDTAGRDVNNFLTYISVAKAYIDNCSVAI